MRIRLDLDLPTTERLITVSVNERRPAQLQAQVLLMRALGVPVPGDEQREGRSDAV